jgi:hypothetical protein
MEIISGSPDPLFQIHNIHDTREAADLMKFHGTGASQRVIRFVPLKQTPSRGEGGKAWISTVVGIAGLPKDKKSKPGFFIPLGGMSMDVGSNMSDNQIRQRSGTSCYNRDTDMTKRKGPPLCDTL